MGESYGAYILELQLELAIEPKQALDIHVFLFIYNNADNPGFPFESSNLF